MQLHFINDTFFLKKKKGKENSIFGGKSTVCNGFAVSAEHVLYFTAPDLQTLDDTLIYGKKEKTPHFSLPLSVSPSLPPSPHPLAFKL